MDDSIPFSRSEAKKVAAASFVHPVAFSVWVAGLFVVSSEMGSPLIYIAMGTAFAAFLVITVVLFGAMVRIAGQSKRSFGRMMLDLNTRIPWSLMAGNLGRKTYEAAGWPPAMFRVQRVLFILAFAGAIGWVIFGSVQTFSQGGRG